MLINNYHSPKTLNAKAKKTLYAIEKLIFVLFDFFAEVVYTTV